MQWIRVEIFTVQVWKDDILILGIPTQQVIGLISRKNEPFPVNNDSDVGKV